MSERPKEVRVKNRFIRKPKASFVRIQHGGTFYYYEINGNSTVADEEVQDPVGPPQPSEEAPDHGISHPQTATETESQPLPADPSAATQEVRPKPRSPVQAPEAPDNQFPLFSQNLHLMENSTDYLLPPRFESGLPLFRRDLGMFVGIQRRL